MHQTGAVRGGQPAEHRTEHRRHGVGRHGSALAQQLAQGAALDELHHQKRVPRVGALVVDRDQPGILQARDGAGLALEAGEELLVARVARIHHLHGDGTVEPGVETAVHRRGAAAGDLRLDQVAAVQQRVVQQVRRPGLRPRTMRTGPAGRMSLGHGAIVGAAP